jgi:glyoxylase-like metal-dependent hydrolase (beta-lactamase superfamily II)
MNAVRRCGSYTIEQHNFGFFRLDGGSMFGSVPKNLWSKRIPADADNCIRLATRSLVLRDGERTVLVDCGMGEKWNDKQRAIYGIENVPRSIWSFAPESVTDLVLTHLHFDHAGGISEAVGDGSFRPVFANARVHVQESNVENAKSPTIKERASYLAENYGALEEMSVSLVDGTAEILPGILVHRVDGHTRGQQWIEIVGSPSIFFATDLVPTSHHLPLPFHMGYDTCAETLLQEKDNFLARAVQENAVVFFEHDPEIPAVTVTVDERGHYAVRERVDVG